MENIQKTIGAQDWRIFNQAETLFNDLFIRKAPALPEQGKDILVTLAPFWAIVLIAFGLLGIVFGSVAVLFGLFGTALSAITLSGGGVLYSVLGIIRSIVGLGLGLLILLFLVKSLSGLFNKQAAGWRFLFRAQVVSLIYGAFSWAMTILTALLSFDGFTTVAGIGLTILMLPVWAIFFALGFYLLFQVKSRYL